MTAQRRRNRAWRNRFAGLTLLALLLLGIVPSMAPAGVAPVFPPEARPFGLTFSAWAARWWQWGLSQPGAAPLLDPTGAHCADGQKGPVWFLAGSFSSDAVTRNCTVPLGASLLLPVVNDGAFAFPDDPAEQKTEQFLRGQVDPPVRAATALTATVDGANVRAIKARYFEDSVLFSVTVPADNIFGLPGGTVVGPSADAGYYLMVLPLPPGRHTIHFAGTLPPASGSGPPLLIDVTDHITVRLGR
jgi:hypothetical protein